MDIGQMREVASMTGLPIWYQASFCARWERAAWRLLESGADLSRIRIVPEGICGQEAEGDKEVLCDGE